jgi:hypothetical protein
MLTVSLFKVRIAGFGVVPQLWSPKRFYPISQIDKPSGRHRFEVQVRLHPPLKPIRAKANWLFPNACEWSCPRQQSAAVCERKTVTFAICRSCRAKSSARYSSYPIACARSPE